MPILPEPPECGKSFDLKYVARIASGLHVEFTYTAPNRIDAAWTPDVPRKLTGRAARAYAAARVEFYQRMADHRGEEIALVGYGADGQPVASKFEPSTAGRA